MRPIPSAILVLLLALPVEAAGEPAKPRPYALTPQEAREGWIELFDGESTYGWTATDGGQWTIFDGMMAPPADKPGPLVTTTAFGDYEVKIQYQHARNSAPQLLLDCDARGREVTPGGEVHLALQPKTWTELTVRAEGAQVDERSQSLGGLVRIGSRSHHSRTGRSGHLALKGPGLVIRSIKLRPLGTNPIFDGKTLRGWKEIPGKKSKFTVTKEGWLNVKDGPGDLQTEGQWADFVLQLDCKTNADKVNSGVFFRCIPGAYKQGYEAQILNQFMAEPKLEYNVEEYDPQTHQLMAKKKMKSPAVDFGTGGIYNRMPARKGVAKDHEWFKMTIAAHGRHIAVWVDGVQVSDWTDNRPINDNPRKGCRLEKGAISLQGHDRHTDISFRNIQIAELAKAPPLQPAAPAPPKP
jgi:hypothetical protein